MKVVCRSCFREERWAGAEHEVVMEGGRRSPTEHPVLMAWNTLKQAHLESQVAVGACICGQPLVGTGPRVPWTLALPNTEIVVTDTLQGPKGALNPEQVSAQVEAVYAAGLFDDIEPVPTMMQLGLMTPLIVPFILWFLAMVSVSLFLWSFAQPPGFR